MEGKPIWWFSSKSRKELERFSRDFLDGTLAAFDKPSGMWDLLAARGGPPTKQEAAMAKPNVLKRLRGMIERGLRDRLKRPYVEGLIDAYEVRRGKRDFNMRVDSFAARR